MSSKIFRVPDNGAFETYKWESVPNLVVRRAAPPQPARPPSEDAEQERALQSRLQAEREQGFRQGEAAGRQAAMQQLDAEFRRLAHAVEEAAGYKSRLRAQAEREVVELAMAVAHRILRRELQIDPEAILGLVKAALERVTLREVSEIHVAPVHEGPLSSHLSRIGAPESVKVVADKTLEPGALILRTVSGQADASVQTQLEEISRGFADALGGQR